MLSSTSRSHNPHFYRPFQSEPQEQSKYSQAQAKEESEDGAAAPGGGKQATPLWCQVSVKRDQDPECGRWTSGVCSCCVTSKLDTREEKHRKSSGMNESSGFLSVGRERCQGLATGRHGAMCPADGPSKYEGRREQMDYSI